MGAPQIEYEAGQVALPFEELTDSGDMTKFESSSKPWSEAGNNDPVVAPYGLLTGGAITPTGTDNQVSVAALTASMAGVSGADSQGNISVSTGTVLASRGTSGDPFRITSITVSNAGALAAVPGTAGDAFTEERGEAGGPPYIPVGSIEIGQVRLSTHTDAVIGAGQIFAVPGLHVERADFPVFGIDYGRGEINFAQALPAIHTGDLPKKVFAKFATPLFSPIPLGSNWSAAEVSASIQSVDTYDGPSGSASTSLGQASFDVQLRDGMRDAVIAAKGKNIWFRFRPDRDRSFPHQLTQGILSVNREWPAGGGSVSASCTVTARAESIDVTE